MSEEKVVREVRFSSQDKQEPEPPPGFVNVGGQWFAPQFLEFVKAAADGTLPTPPEAEEIDPQAVALMQELSAIHLPEWVAPNGRKLASPTMMSIKGALRVAQYLIQRGVTFDPDKATVRWVPTPGITGHAGDPGKHIYRNSDGTWPEDPDIEEFWSLDQIETHQLPNGRWAAVHPRGRIQCEDGSKDQAFAMCVERVRAKVAELKGQQ
ncbi:hypothetical protein [Nocardia asiatica]|uniref:hypothetical protein n=1 Tax=Nocardia asiatica TaxID=209252 RepID=UPI002453EC87|nr:hypothetical protein [Nocardia asiatica]